MNIKYITCPSGDWVVLMVDGTPYYEGHSVPDFVWLSLLEDQPGTKISSSEISDKDMENKSYL